MAFIEGEIIIARPAGAVFDFAADQRNEPRYNPRMVRADKLTRGPVGKGTVFRSAVLAMGRANEMRSELTGYHRPSRLASRTTMAQADIAGTLNFAPVPGGTRMRWAWVIRPKGASRLLTPVIGQLGRRQERAIWTGMKRYLEAQPQPGRDDLWHRTDTGTGTGRERLDRRPDHRAGGRLGPAADLPGPDRRERDPNLGGQRTGSLWLRDHEYRYVRHQGYALASDSINLHGLGLFVDQVRIRITPSNPSRPLFAGIATAGDVERYLGGVSYTTAHGHDVTDHSGARVPAAPAATLPWAARAQGTGTLTLTWAVRGGDWRVVVMNTDARPGLSVRAEAGISALALPWMATELLAAGLLTGVAAGVLIVVPVRLASRRRPA